MLRFAFGMGLSTIFLAMGCSGPAEEEDTSVTAESELRIRNCTLLETCPDAITIVSAVDYGEEVPDVVRADVTIANDSSTVAYELQRRTFGPITANAPVSMKLSGGAADAPFVIDDVLVVEMIDAQTSERIAAVSAGWYAPGKLLLDGVALPHVGGTESVNHVGGSIDLGPWVPQNRAFKLRVTAIDTGITGRVSNIVAHVSAAATPPAPERDPFADDACEDSPITLNQTKGFFAPGATTAVYPVPLEFHTRERNCNAVTGCTAWRNTDKTAFTIVGDGRGSGIPVRSGQDTRMHLFVSHGRIYGSLKGTKYDRPGQPGYVNTLGAIFPVGTPGGGSFITAVGDVATKTGTPVRGSTSGRKITTTCAQIKARVDTNDPSLQRQVVWFGHL